MSHLMLLIDLLMKVYEINQENEIGNLEERFHVQLNS